MPKLADLLRDCLEQTGASWQRGEAWSGDDSSWHWAQVLREAIGDFVSEFQTAVGEDLSSAAYPPGYSFSGASVAQGHDELRILGDYDSTRRALRYQLEQVLREQNPVVYATLQRAALAEQRFPYPNWAPWAPLHWFERLIEVAERHWGREAPALNLMRGFVHCMAELSPPVLAHLVDVLERYGISVPADADADANALPSASGASETEETEALPWTGLEAVAHSQRTVLARAIVPGVIAHLAVCLGEQRAAWSRSRAHGHDGEDPRQWAARLDERQEMILNQVHDHLRQDIEAAGYPPAYSFSGVGFAVGATQLCALGDYASTRRSLRHELEGLLRANHRQAYTELRRAALHESRFQHPNWAPWSPLHWYERLMETLESAFGQSALTLSLMQAYTQHIDSRGDVLVAQTLDAVETCGLLEGAADALEEIADRNRAERDLGHTWADCAPEPEAESPAAPANAHGARTHGDPIRMAMPTDPGNVNQWTHWMVHMAAKLRGSASGTALLDGPDPRLDPAGAAGALENGQQAERAGTGGFEFSTVGEVPFGVGARNEMNAPAAQQPHVVASAAVKSIARDLLRGLLDRISDRREFHPEAMSALDRAVPILGDAVSTDFTFLTSRQHPLRCWMGELVNTSLCLDPDLVDTDSGGNGEYLRCLNATVDSLQSVADRLDETRKTRVLNDWHEALAQLRSEWQTKANVLLEPMLHRERLAQAKRSFTACALAADATPPQSAADTIVVAWAELLSMETAGSQTALGERVRDVVQAICERSGPSAIKALVQSLVNTAQDSGVPATNLQTCMQGLAEGHRKVLKSPSGGTRFDPRSFIRERVPVRERDDDPDLLVDRADTRVFDARHLRVGDWFEFIDKTTGSPRRLCLFWHGEASRSFLFVSLNGISKRTHSLQGVAHELREGRLQQLPHDNPLDALLR